MVIVEGVMIAVECKAWAENIEHDSMERRGLAHFEVKLQNSKGFSFLHIATGDDRLVQQKASTLENVVVMPASQEYVSRTQSTRLKPRELVQVGHCLIVK
jgi:hypothetical protein